MYKLHVRCTRFANIRQLHNYVFYINKMATLEARQVHRFIQKRIV